MRPIDPEIILRALEDEALAEARRETIMRQIEDAWRRATTTGEWRLTYLVAPSATR